MFKYPLTKDELFENSAVNTPKALFLEELEGLLKNNFLKEQESFILTGQRSSHDVSVRLNGNKGAREMMPLAAEYSKKIASFPFVQAVLLSGGLSKNYYDAKSDVDYFIITAPNRLWICRTLLILRYKLLPADRKKYWCTNYFVSADNMVIPDHNAFTATELAYLIPTVNYPLYKKLLQQNSWYKSEFPNKHEAVNRNVVALPQPFFKRMVEGLLKGAFGLWLDNCLLSLTLKRWRKKYPGMSDEDFELQFRSRKDVCKRHTHGFQNMVLLTWQAKKQEFERQFGVQLCPSKA